ncbi:hypothetical protein BDF21DRAFT_424606 [Thamnidium elegans]|uniref:Uncharacterized protein n=1 Tax=Thamnidium elegans TaxID=101142 RepID=A0A8H7W3U5_9FUNG|nr:hypothetical protein INT48_005600 [Thamnidium elegans]KAI8071967.1 hypothetical protein BDF21DRAFT_424606 [Thamnidium elegans]
MDERSNKTVRERADAIERLQSSFSTERGSVLPGYSRSTVSSLKRSSMSGSADTNCRLNKLRRLDSSNRESSPTLSEISSVSSTREGDNFESVVMYAKILQYQHMTREMEREYSKSEQIAESELAALERELKGLEAEEINRHRDQESQNKLDTLCKQITACMGRIDMITKGEGDLDKEKKTLISILSQLNETNVPTLHNNPNLLNECINLIKAIIEA